MACIVQWVLLLAIGSGLLISANGSPATAILSENELPMMSTSMELESGSGRPARPRLFQSPEQIKMYLDTLGKYYTYHNRNRFGKRSEQVAQLSPYKESYDTKGFQEYDFRSPL